MPNLIPDDTKHFIVAHIDSIAELEAILFVRNHRDRCWTSQAVGKQLYLSEADTAKVLGKLVDRGFVRAGEKGSGEYQYQPASRDMARMIDQLAEVYATYLVPVTNLIHRKSRRSIEGLADAFKFRKEG